MAIDTANKRFSMLNFGTVPTVPLFSPSGSIGGGDRLHFLNLYAGIASETPIIIATEELVDWLYRNDRHYPAVDVTVGTPFAEFTWDATTAPPTVFFTNQSVGAISFMWDFGDSQSSTDPNPTHTFAFVGTSATFAVSLYINGDPNLSVTHLVEVTLLTGAPNLTLNTLTMAQLNTLTVSQLNTLPVA